MIQLEEIHIQKFRGIRDLLLKPNKKSFAIQGPNGSGKSGVVDAIDFCLTGNICRLSGPGTQGVTTKKHGPHVDFAKTPEEASVRITAFLTAINKQVTITRNLKSPSSPKIEPSSPEILAELDEISNHPELALSRRQIIKFVLTTGTDRSKDIQSLLRLESVSEIRGALKTARNSANKEVDSTQARVRQAGQELLAHLGLKKLDKKEILGCVNKHREKLGLVTLEEFVANTSLLDGVDEKKANPSAVLKRTALADLKLFADSTAPQSLTPEVQGVVELALKINSDSKLRHAVRQKQLVSDGLELLVDDECPLCNEDWDLQKLTTHLQGRLVALGEAEKVAVSLSGKAGSLKQKLQEIDSNTNQLVDSCKRLKLSDESVELAAWGAAISTIANQLDSTETVLAIADSLTDSLQIPKSIEKAINALQRKVDALHSQTAIQDSTAFLLEAEKRLDRYRDKKRDEAVSREVAKLSEETYSSYCGAAESVLGSLFKDVESQFMAFYQAINSDDEGEFTASLTPAETTLDFTVDFHKRGEFPPAAYHSEGHQDAMGLCLYLSLMQRLFGANFRMVVLDDVVMSVDVQHRRLLCDLLRQQFPETQFIITTHEKAWFKQMQSTRLIPQGNGKEFLRWTVDQGPIVADAKSSWEKVGEALLNNDIPEAAFRLRNHIEHVAPEFVENLGGSVPFRSDGAYNGGQMLSAAVKQLGKLLKLAGNPDLIHKDSQKQEQLLNLLNSFKTSRQQQQVEEWAINKAVHFNPWENFSPEEFTLVVDAFRGLLSCFHCNECESPIYLLPKGCFQGKEEALRCDCTEINFNLKKPNKVVREKRKRDTQQAIWKTD